MDFFAASAAHIQDLTAKEAIEAGADPDSVSVIPGGVEFSGDLAVAYRFSLWSRTASRLLLLLGTGESIESGDQLHHRAMQIPWFDHIGPDTSFSVHATVKRSRWLRDSRYAALKVKDAIADQMREIHDRRPSVDTEDPDIRFHVHIDGVHGYFYLDLTGQSLHRRGYRRNENTATMKEDIAAALLYRAGWPEHTDMPLLDPFCGSGTIPIEAALMATDSAPGLFHAEDYAFLKWKNHDQELWNTILGEAEERRAKGLKKSLTIHAWDTDAKAVQSAESHARNCGMEEFIQFSQENFTKTAEAPHTTGLIVTDPPYGIRLESAELKPLYSKTGEILAEKFPGWRVSIMSGAKELLRELHVKPDRTNSLFNGGIECLVYHFSLFTAEEREKLTEKAAEKKQEREEAELTLGAQMFANRLKKNQRMLKSFLKKSGATSYRLYDADMPEYSAAIDIYENTWIHLQEYAPPKTIDERSADKRLNEMIDGVNRVTGIPYEHIYVKQRKRQKGDNQYTKHSDKGQMYIMRENGHRFYVNFTDYIDTGIFLDHRPVRKLIQQMSRGKRFLNLFGYTGTATVHAAAGGALSTITVDSSNRYLSWAEQNMELNGFTGMAHQYYQEDCLTWLKEKYLKFDLIFLDPPTFSNSKSRNDEFDIQRDHEELIISTMMHLEKEGTLIFSNNFRKFELSPVLFDRYEIEEITRNTIPNDFGRNLKIHRCWMIKLKKKKKYPSQSEQPPVKTVIKKKPAPAAPVKPKKPTRKRVKVVSRPEKSDTDLTLDF